MAEARSWHGPEDIREPKDDNEREQALKLGMLVITGIESIRNGTKFSGLPCGFEAGIRTLDGFWELHIVEKVEE